MEKIIITPREVRALGNIVSPKSKKDFLGGAVTQSTGPVQGIPSTIYTSSYLPSTKLHVEGEHHIKSDKSVHLDVKLTTSNNRPVRSGTVYCAVNKRTYTKTLKSNGTCEFNILNLPDGLHTLKIYYLGSTELGGCFRNFTVVLGDDLILDLLGTHGLVQTGEYSELFGILTSEDIGVPGVRVDFYEEFILSFIRAYASKDLFQTGETVDITARVSDVDGSGVAEQKVRFYELFNINFSLSASPELIQTGGYSEVTARLTDSDGSPIRDQKVKFYETYEISKVRVNASKDLLQTGGMVDVFGIVADSDGSRIPGAEVKFYEVFEYANLSVMSTGTLIQTGGTVDVSARLSDEDGSAISDTEVKFYEYYDLGSLRVNSTAPVIQSGSSTDISAVLKDEDGSLIRDERVDFSETIDSTGWSILLSEPDDLIQIDDTIDIAATVKDNNNTAVSGIYVRFYYNKEGE